MSFLDDLRSAKFSPTAAYQQFVTEYPRNKEDVFAFLEGRDDPSFYFSFLANVIADIRQIHLYKCDNKHGVYRIYTNVMNLANKKSRILFFVDKDHSDYIGEENIVRSNIFVTEYYSIENYIVTENMLRRVWEELYNIKNYSIPYEIISDRFRTELDKFYKSMLPMSAWIIFVRRNGLKPCLDNVKLGKLFIFSTDFELEPVSEDSIFSYLEQVFSIEIPDNLYIELPNVILELSKNEPKKYIRGKYELWFFIKFLEKLRELLLIEGGNNVNIRTTIGEANAIEILGPRIILPKSLQDYFVKNKIISSIS